MECPFDLELLDDRQREAVRKAMDSKAKYERGLRAEVRRAFCDIELLEATGIPRLMAVSIVGMPRGAWELLTGASRGKPEVAVTWQRRGRNDRGDAYRLSATHYSKDGQVTLCGQVIPSKEDHDLTWDQMNGRSECQSCRDLLTRRNRRGVHRNG